MLLRFLVSCVGLLVVLGTTKPAFATSLSDLAESLEPGEWGELHPDGMLPAISETSDQGATGSIFPFAEDGVWHGPSGRFMFIGSDHIYDPSASDSGPRFIAYEEATDSVGVMPRPGWFPRGTRHGYDHSAVLGDELFHIEVLEAQPLRRYDLLTNTWSEGAPLSETGYQRFGALEPFPSLGGLIYVEQGKVFLWDQGSNRWSVLASDVPMGEYHNFAEYNPVHNLVLLGGGNGSRVVHILEADRTLRRVADAPFSLRVNQAVVTLDPLSGDFLVFGGSGEFYVFDPIADEWRLQPDGAPVLRESDEPVAMTIAGPVDTYGVVMFMQHRGRALGGEARVFIYRHAPGMGTGRPDAGPTDAGAGPTDAGPTDAGPTDAVQVDGEDGAVARDSGMTGEPARDAAAPTTPILKGGCTVSGSHSPAPSLLWTLIAVAVCLRRQRREQR